MRGSLILLVAVVASVHAFPSYLASGKGGGGGGDDNQGVLIVVPPVSNDIGLKAISGKYLHTVRHVDAVIFTNSDHAYIDAEHFF